MDAVDLPHECTFASPANSLKARSVDEYSSWATIALHGLKEVNEAQGRIKRVLWALLVLGGTLASIVNTTSSFGYYLENFSATRVSIKDEPILRFPAIYVCPKSPDALNQSLVREDIRKQLGPYWSRMDEESIRQMVAYAIAGAGVHNMEKILEKFTVDSRMRLTRLFRKWVGKRTYEAFYKTLFETNGYRCDEMFHSCYYAKQQVQCCDIFEQSYVMLRGRCFRLKKFYQTYPDRHGVLTIVIKRLPSWFVEKDGTQAQALIYLTDPGAEAATFPRYYFNPSDWNQIIVTKRRIKMLESNPHCEKRCRRCGSECYIKRQARNCEMYGLVYAFRWLYQRVVDPLNCTLYYQQHHAPGYKVCNPWEIVTRYVDVIDESTNGSTKCLPSCDREDYYFHQVNVKDSMMNGKKAIPSMLFRFDLHYSDLEVETYEEVVTTTVPGFVAELGGQSNLFLGLSIISVIQAVRILGLKTGSVLQWTLRTVFPRIIRSTQ